MIEFWNKFKNRFLMKLAGSFFSVSYISFIVFVPYAEAEFWENRRKSVQKRISTSSPKTQIASLAIHPSITPSTLHSQRIGGNITQEIRRSIPQNKVSDTDPKYLIQQFVHRSQEDHTSKKINRNTTVPFWLWDRVSPYGEISNIHLTSSQELSFNKGKIFHSEPLVIHIQDVHNVPGVQKNIAFLIRDFIRSGISQVGIEGSWGTLSELNKWKQYPDKESLLEVAGYLLNEGYLTGAELAGLEEESPYSSLYGIENKQIYNKQVEAFKKSLKSNPSAITWISEREKDLKAIKNNTYSPLLHELDRFKNQYDEGSLKLGEWINYLAVLYNIPSTPNSHLDSKYTNIESYLYAYRIEKNLDFNKVKEEQSEVLKTLSRRLNSDELVSLLEESILYRLGKLNNAEFYEKIDSLIKKYRVKVKNEFKDYMRYVRSIDLIEQNKLFHELQNFERDVWQRSFSNESQRIVFDLDSDFRLVKKGIDFTLNPTDWQIFFIRQKEIFRLDQRFNQYSEEVQSVTPLSSSLTQSLYSVLENVNQFNIFSNKRSEIFVQNVENKISKGKLDASLLIAGGYHTEDIEKLLQSKGISFITIRPNLDLDLLEKDHHPLESFNRKLLPLEKVFYQEKISIAPNQALGSGVHHPINKAVTGAFSSVLPPLTVLSTGETGLTSVKKFFQNTLSINIEIEIVREDPKWSFIISLGDRTFNISFFGVKDQINPPKEAITGIVRNVFVKNSPGEGFILKPVPLNKNKSVFNSREFFNQFDHFIQNIDASNNILVFYKSFLNFISRIGQATAGALATIFLFSHSASASEILNIPSSIIPSSLPLLIGFIGTLPAVETRLEGQNQEVQATLRTIRYLDNQSEIDSALLDLRNKISSEIGLFERFPKLLNRENGEINFLFNLLGHLHALNSLDPNGEKVSAEKTRAILSALFEGDFSVEFLPIHSTLTSRFEVGARPLLNENTFFKSFDKFRQLFSAELNKTPLNQNTLDALSNAFNSGYSQAFSTLRTLRNISQDVSQLPSATRIIDVSSLLSSDFSLTQNPGAKLIQKTLIHLVTTGQLDDKNQNIVLVANVKDSSQIIQQLKKIEIDSDTAFEETSQSLWSGALENAYREGRLQILSRSTPGGELSIKWLIQSLNKLKRQPWVSAGIQVLTDNGSRWVMDKNVQNLVIMELISANTARTFVSAQTIEAEVKDILTINIQQ